ncbi:Putative ubiquitin-like-specific protease 1B [Dendrobium catenatum]|uniref:Ubiquitin-like-specific protease 1B n=1 Tax=Dendrobium catenatum TaxID=906689 RepID=A0A2I0X5F7_9ASPA|nr:Putative ubiquitin-like-specific protease 1B [Dendrobium catenatum]
MMDEILSDSYLDNDHVDSFAILLNEKARISLEQYHKYLYISPMHYKLKDESLKLFLEHIDYSSVHSCSIIINPIIDGSHWTILVGYRKQKKWEFYDSVPNHMNRSIAVKIIASLNKDYKKAFDENITKWSFKTIKKAPTQTNNTDCSMFVCKYMENIVRQNNSKWKESTDWHEKMLKYRA